MQLVLRLHTWVAFGRMQDFGGGIRRRSLLPFKEGSYSPKKYEKDTFSLDSHPVLGSK